MTKRSRDDEVDEVCEQLLKVQLYDPYPIDLRNADMYSHPNKNEIAYFVRGKAREYARGMGLFWQDTCFVEDESKPGSLSKCGLCKEPFEDGQIMTFELDRNTDLDSRDRTIYCYHRECASLIPDDHPVNE